MPKPIPFPTRKKEAPADSPGFPEQPVESEILKADLSETPRLKIQPNESPLKEDVPEVSPAKEDIPEVSPKKEEIPEPSPAKNSMPSDLNMENVVTICGKQIEIKPTKLKYFRNKTTSSYGYLKAIPLNEYLGYDKGVLDKTKDADQLLYDFLVAAFDDPVFVRDNYDEMTADDVDRIIKIFGRINHIDEKEEAARKNREAQEAKH